MLEQSKAFAGVRNNVHEVKNEVTNVEQSQSKSFERLEALILHTRASPVPPAPRIRAPACMADASAEIDVEDKLTRAMGSNDALDGDGE
eukprot:3073860-Karenia_brevis.AAC.2